ncbi:MAG: hypothetical protein ACK5II_05210 [Paracoccus sp. (in: a-proteobacteria)]
MLTHDDVPEHGSVVVSVPTQQYSEIITSFRPTALIIDIESSGLELLENGDLSGFRIIIVKLHRGILGRNGIHRCRDTLKAAGLEQNSEYCRRGVETWVRP